MPNDRDDAIRPLLLTRGAMADIEEYVERTFGPFETVIDEIESPDIHVDLIPVPPTLATPWLAVVTMGMSAYRMTTPEGVPPYAEVFILLPEQWPASAAAFESLGEDAWWPFRRLKEVARLPITTGSWVGEGHTIEITCPSCSFTNVLLTRKLWPGGGLELFSGRKAVRVLQLVPLYRDEFQFRAERGTAALLDRLREISPHELANPKRRSTCSEES